ncbi:MAG: hypothetical protein K0S53_2460 [Bacteroidetes bacterium]|jgi:hypothetical protein|nr:hypothetical protein [Bacteroidota bacterium]MDF2450898.1 hypothetical protein [Bacteroidota bacterium]
MVPKINKKNNLQLSLTILAFMGCLIYILYKAFHLSFTHDESYTYLHYVHQGFMDIISYKTPYTNNHILNTVLIKYCEELLGSAEIVLRLPNILAFIVYSVFAILLLQKKCPDLLFPFYLLLTIHPFLLEFFALARGYGLSIGFLMMSLYFIRQYLTTPKPGYLIWFNVAAFLAVMSNFSLLNYYVAALIAFNLYSYLQVRTSHNEIQSFTFFKLNKINIISVLISGMVLYEPLRRLSKKGLLDFGGKNGFLADTVGSSIDDLFYEMAAPFLLSVLIKVFIVCVCFGVLILIFAKLMKRNSIFFERYSFLVFVNVTLFLIVFITQIQHLLLGNDFYVHRFALFFYPLFILNLIVILNYVYTKKRKFSVFISYSFAGLLLFNFYVNYNLKHFKEWRYDKETKMVMQKLISEHEKDRGKQVQLGINWLFEPGTNFYRYTWDLNWMIPTHRKGISGGEDYWYLFGNDPEFNKLKTGEILFENKETDVFLLKNVE